MMKHRLTAILLAAAIGAASIAGPKVNISAEEQAQAGETSESIITSDEDVLAFDDAKDIDETAETPFNSTQNIGSMSITVQAPEGVFPKDSYFTAAAVSAGDVVDKVRADGKNVARRYAFDITVYDKDGNEIEPDTSKGDVRVAFQNNLIENNQLDCDVYHVPDGSDTAERLSGNQSGDTVTVNTDSFSLYVVEFTYDRMSYTMRGSTAVKLSEILNAVGLSGSVSDAKSSNTTLFDVLQQNGVWMVKTKKAFNSSETLTVVLDGIVYKIAVIDDNTDAKNIYIRSLSTQLFYGAAKDADGYVWNVSDYYDGHRFSYRINFAISGVDTAAAKSVKLTIPKSILTDRDGNTADTTEFSIPSRTDVESATDANGNINTSEIDTDVNYAYYEDGDSYVIYNFRDIPAAENSYIELSYVTSRTTYSYVDNAAQKDFTCSMTVGDGTGANQTKSADPISLRINTGATLNSASETVAGTRRKTWDDAWGTAVKPADPDKYYYLVWRIHSYVSATQPYNFTIDDSIAGNYDGMTVLGYRFSGQNTFGTGNTETKAISNRDRYDYILTSIPLDTYSDKTLWTAKDAAKVTVTPFDLVDDATEKTTTANWEWAVPVWNSPAGHFNVYKIGDDAYRIYGKYNYSLFRGTQHNADTLDFKANDYSRYDLEEFDGYNGEGRSLSEYGPFDFASWVVGYPYEWTRDTANIDPDKPWNSYGRENVRYELTDDGLYLANTETALLNRNGSSARTIEDGSLDSAHAVKLSSSDYSIKRVQYSWYMRDADYDSEETGEWVSKSPVYTDKDILTFYGRFDGSDSWMQIGTYNIRTGTASPVSDYVKSMTENELVTADGRNMTAYRISTENAHYFTELYSVPYITLRNSDAVMKLMDGREHLVLLNNNHGVVSAQDQDKAEDASDRWYTVFDGTASATDYAIASQKDSKLEKKIISTSNNVRHKYYTITWQINQEETMLSGTGEQSYIVQNGGVFYDLLPAGSIPVKPSVKVESGGNTIPSSGYTVKAIENYRGSGRTMLVVQVKSDGLHYSVTFDTRHSWNSIKDYGTGVYNPAAYETGNASITKGYPDNGGTKKEDGTETASPLSRDVSLMSSLSTNTGASADTVTGNRFIYCQQTWDIIALTSASAGLTKKVRNDTDSAYSYSTMVPINGVYSYELRYMNSSTSSAKNLVFYDSLENYDRSTLSDGGSDSEWHGTVTGIDVSQLTGVGINPVIYVSTKNRLNPETDTNLTDTSVWAKVTDGTDLSSAKAIAIDARKKTDGSDFILKSGSSITAHIYMKAPESAPDTKTGRHPYAYNNIYINNTVFSDDDSDNGSTMLIHQDYTTVSLVVAGDFKLLKKASDTGKPISGVTFRITGTSDYGTVTDKSAVTGSDGTLAFERLERGTYTLQETKSTDDYLLDPAEHKVVIDKAGKVAFDGMDVTGRQAVITNKPRIHADVKLVKIDSVFTSTKLAGALYSLSGTSDYGTAVLVTETSQPKKLDDGSANQEAGCITFSNIEKGTYQLKEVQAPDGYALDRNAYTVKIDETGKASVKSDIERQVLTGKSTRKSITKYSHTSNVSDDGMQNSNYGNNWTNANITGTDRGDAGKAHVVTIPGADTLHVKIVYGGESANYDWVCMWAGSRPDYTAYSNYESSLTRKLGGGSHTSTSNTKEYDVNGDTVTFSFRSDGSGYGDGYGYYAVITGTGKAAETKGTYEVETDAAGHYIMADEPLHQIVLTKKSSYDKTVVGGAVLTLTGTSGAGTAVNQTAVSDADTGTVRFSGLESGTYLLQETKAPDGYEADANKYAVILNTDGSYTINGLTRTGSVYDFYNRKKADKQIVITKVWNDGITTHTPGELAMTIETTVPAASTRTYQITFDANGGSFGSTTSNTLSYNAKNEITSGRYAEPASADSDNYYFDGWSTSKTATSEDTGITLAPNDVTNAYLNKRTAGSSLTLYAVYKARPYIYYAVSPYGIEKETLKEGTAGITFGPATGNMFSQYTYSKKRYNSIPGKYLPMVNAHKVSDTTYLINDSCVDSNGDTTVTSGQTKADMDAVQQEGEAAITDNSRNIIVGDDAGTDSSGNAYRCIHYDNWATILYWNEHDPHVYDKCVKNRCSKRLILRGNSTNITWHTRTAAPDGDGDSYIGTSKWDIYYDNNYTDIDEYSASLIRAELVGADSYTSEDANSAGEGARTRYTESKSAYIALPAEIRNRIGAKALYDTQNGARHGTNVNGSSGPYYDRLWLFDYNEIANPSNTAGSSAYTERGATGGGDTAYDARGSLGWWWLRSRYYNYGARGVSDNGYSSIDVGVDSANRVAPGFVLKR